MWYCGIYHENVVSFALQTNKHHYQQHTIWVTFQFILLWSVWSVMRSLMMVEPNPTSVYHKINKHPEFAYSPGLLSLPDYMSFNPNNSQSTITVKQWHSQEHNQFSPNNASVHFSDFMSSHILIVSIWVAPKLSWSLVFQIFTFFCWKFYFTICLNTLLAIIYPIFGILFPLSLSIKKWAAM